MAANTDALEWHPYFQAPYLDETKWITRTYQTSPI